MSKRPKSTYLREILQACDNIERFMGEYPEMPLQMWTMKYSAVLFQLLLIGEAVRNLLRVTGRAGSTLPPTVDWHRIVGFRNLAIHQYPEIDPEQVHLIVEVHLPALRAEVETLLALEPEPPSP